MYIHMDQVTKIVSKSGNGAIVYVPSKWMNRKVSVNLIDIDIMEELFYLLKPYLKYVIGLYLYGSYARNEEMEDSDIDILIVVNKKFKLKPNRFDIHLVEINSLEKIKNNDPLLFYSIIKESRVLINEYLLETFKKVDVNKLNFSWFIDTSKSALKIDKKLLELDRDLEKYAPNSSIYSIILRARGFYLMKCIKEKRDYTNKDFLNFLISLGFEKKFIEYAYRIYRAAKIDKEIDLKIPLDYTYRLCLKIEELIKKYEKRKKS